jgi:hypothetical protein
MLIEGKRRLNAKPLHHRPADAVGEAPMLVAIGAEHVPGAPHVRFRDRFQIAQVAVEKQPAKFQRTLKLISYSENGQQLIDDLISGDQGL